MVCISLKRKLNLLLGSLVNLAYVNKNIRKQTTIILANNLFGKRTIY